LSEVIKQPQYQPLPVEKQVAILYAATTGRLDDVPTPRVKEFETGLYRFLETERADILKELRETKALPKELAGKLDEAIEVFRTEAFGMESSKPKGEAEPAKPKGEAAKAEAPKAEAAPKGEAEASKDEAAPKAEAASKDDAAPKAEAAPQAEAPSEDGKVPEQAQDKQPRPTAGDAGSDQAADPPAGASGPSAGDGRTPAAATRKAAKAPKDSGKPA
jgi:ATP synthase alpha/beta chain, C terminal domain